MLSVMFFLGGAGGGALRIDGTGSEMRMKKEERKRGREGGGGRVGVGSEKKGGMHSRYPKNLLVITFLCVKTTASPFQIYMPHRCPQYYCPVHAKPNYPTNQPSSPPFALTVKPTSHPHPPLIHFLPSPPHSRLASLDRHFLLDKLFHLLMMRDEHVS